MYKLWLAMITCLLTLGLSTGVYADDDDGFEGFKGGSLYSHRGGRGGGDDDDDDDDDGGDPRDDDDDYYECGPKCKESTQIVLKGRIPCICDISLPSATEIRLFRARQLSRGGNIDDVEIGNFSASCNTGSVYLKLTSQNGALKNMDVADTYIDYDVDVGGIDTFSANTGGTEKSFVWSFMGNNAAVLNGANMLKVENLGGVDGKIAGRYRDVLTVTVSGLPL